MPAASLALCLDAPMQSWGVRARGVYRDTGREPSKSGVIGLLGAALGMPRDDTERIAQLAQLTMGVRVDREGSLERDYHTTQNVPTTAGTGHRTVVSHRYYLADAVFLVVLASDEEETLTTLDDAVRNPRWPLFLGRRAFVPARPVGLGLSDRDLDTVLTTHPWLGDGDRPDLVRTVVDCPPDDEAAELRYDVPLSFGPTDRRYGARTVRTGHIELAGTAIPEGNRVPE